jgi:hypothetical protein
MDTDQHWLAVEVRVIGRYESRPLWAKVQQQNTGVLPGRTAAATTRLSARRPMTGVKSPGWLYWGEGLTPFGPVTGGQ